MGAIDLGAYLRRIGYSGPRSATFDVLQALHRARGGYCFEQNGLFLGVRHPDGGVTRSELPSPQALHEVLASDFGIEIEREEIARAWPRLPRPD